MKIIALDNQRGFELVADSALTLPGKPTFVPDGAADWRGRLMLAVRVSRLGKSISAKFAPRYFDAVTTALRLIAYDVEGQQLPGVSALSDFALTIGHWTEPVEGPVEITLDDTAITLDDIIGPAVEAIVAASDLATLKMGDILLLPLPFEETEAKAGLTFTSSIGGRQVLQARLK